MEVYNVCGTQVTVMYVQIQDLMYAEAVHLDRYALEEVIKLHQNQGWLLDEMVWCGGYWSLSLVMDTGVIVM